MGDNILTPVCEVCDGELAEMPKSSPYNNFLDVTTAAVKTRESSRIVSLNCGHAGHKICMKAFFSHPDQDGTRGCPSPSPNCNKRHPVKPDLQNVQLNFKPSKTLNEAKETFQEERKELQKKLKEAQVGMATAEHFRDAAESLRSASESNFFSLMEEKETKYRDYEREIADLREQLKQHPRPLLIDLTNSPRR